MIVSVCVTPCVAMAGGTCPDGWSALTHAKTVLAPVCSSQSTDLGPVVVKCDTNSTTCSPDVACGSMKYIRTGNGVSVPLYSKKYTTPALNIAVGDTVCYANLIPGSATGTISINDGTGLYHTANLRRCLELSPSVVPVMAVPETYLWYGVAPVERPS